MTKRNVFFINYAWFFQSCPAIFRQKDHCLCEIQDPYFTPMNSEAWASSADDTTNWLTAAEEVGELDNPWQGWWTLEKGSMAMGQKPLQHPNSCELWMIPIFWGFLGFLSHGVPHLSSFYRWMFHEIKPPAIGLPPWLLTELRNSVRHDLAILPKINKLTSLKNRLALDIY